MSATRRLGGQIEPLLKQIERLLPPEYRLTLIIRHVEAEDRESDLLMSSDDLGKVQESLAFLIDNGKEPT